MAVQMEYDYEQTTAKLSNFNQNDIDSLKEWSRRLEKSCVPKDLSDKQLVLFYNACEGEMDKTKKCIEKYYSCKNNSPELFSNRNVENSDLKDSLETLEFSVLPEQTPQGYDIIFHRLHNSDPSKYHLDVGIKLLLMTVDECLYSRGPQAGVIFLFDMRGVKLTHLTRLSVSTLRKFFTYIQEAMPLRMRAIHIMNAVSFFDKVLAILRPFMDKKLVDMIKLHTSNEDLTEFYSIIPQSCLPPDYGGTLPDTRTLHSKNTERLRHLEPYFAAEEAQRANVGQIVQSFNKLEID